MAFSNRESSMSRTDHPLLLLSFSVLLLLAVTATGARAGNRIDFLTITYENDIFFGRDSGYTNGVGISWAHGPFKKFGEGNISRLAHRWTKRLYISTMPGKNRAVSYSVGQAMQTADDISIAELVPENAPYAGLLLWTGTLYAYDEAVADRLTLQLGVVGPASGAEKVQELIHKLIGSDAPQGWDNQLSNEPVFRLEVDRSWRYSVKTWSNGTGIDFIGFAEGGVGNLMSDVGAGLSLRVGHNLARTFPAATIYPGRGINPLAGIQQPKWNAFLNLLTNYVFNDIMINGNTFVDSHRVDLVHGQVTVTAGVAFNIGDWAFLLSAARGTDRYETQELPTRFGSLSVTFRF
jgi:lipid A 3-O-deacylase